MMMIFICPNVFSFFVKGKFSGEVNVLVKEKIPVKEKVNKSPLSHTTKLSYHDIVLYLF
jgi:hypothetical protein